MLVTCFRCKRSLSSAESEGPPAFCMYCGQKLRESSGSLEPGGMLTASHVPFSDNPEEDAAASEPPPSEVGGYRLLRFLGAGGMGAVYEAESPESGQHVAVKLLSKRLASSPASVERFRQEGRLASQLSHPRCVFVLSADTDAGRPYIVMELMPGRTLKDLVDRGGPIPPNEAIAHILDTIDGLAEAHRLGVIHRDVKPSNCFVTADDRVKIGDFGLSKSLAGSGDQHLTQTGAFLGTVLFASPEQIRGEPLDYGSDVYSVCATLYYLLCGEAPYQHESATAALAKAISEAPPPICAKQPMVSRALERVVMRGLERDRERRWQSLDDLREALVELLPSRQSPARPRAIIGAYLLDWMILLLAVVIPLQILHSLLQWPQVHLAGTLIDPVAWALCIAYFATFEGLLGRTLGKSLLGLRVARMGQSGPPGLERGWIRSGTFGLLWFWIIYADAFLGKELGPWALLAAFGLGAFAILIQLRRTSGGYRGLHDFLSGCRVTQKPLPVRRLRLYSRFPNPLDDLLPANEAEPLPGIVGGYAVKGRIWFDAISGEQVWSAEDRALSRRVLLWLTPDDGNTATPSVNEVPRLTRLRRLGRGALHWAGLDREWVAFAAPVGSPLADAVRKPLSWADARPLLEQLAEELHASKSDGSTPARLGLGNIWIEPNGRIQVLDFPLPLGRMMPIPAASLPANHFTILRQAASLILEGEPRAETVTSRKQSGIRAPVPPHAAPIFSKLFAAKGYASLEEFQGDLRETHAHPPEVTPAIRAAHVGIQAVLLGFGLLLMFLATGVAWVALLKSVEEHALETEELLADIRDSSKVEELKRLPGATAAINNPRALARLEACSEYLRTEGMHRRKALLAPQRFLMPSIDRAFEEIPKTREATLRTENQLLIWAASNEKVPAGKGDSPWHAEAFSMWPVVIAVPLIWILAAAVFRGGLSMLITGIAVVRADGRRAFRRQCAFRAAVVWLPITVLLLACIWLQIEHYRYAYVYSALWLAAVVLLPIYVLLALRNPSRPPQDRVAGTYLVPL